MNGWTFSPNPCKRGQKPAPDPYLLISPLSLVWQVETIVFILDTPCLLCSLAQGTRIHGWDQVKVWISDRWKSPLNASQNHCDCFLKDIWILKPGYNLKSSTHVHTVGETGLKFKSWKVQNHVQNAAEHHFSCFLREIWILKSSYRQNSSICDMRQAMELSLSYRGYNYEKKHTKNTETTEHLSLVTLHVRDLVQGFPISSIITPQCLLASNSRSEK